MRIKFIIKEAKTNAVLQTCYFDNQPVLDNFVELLQKQRPWGRIGTNEILASSEQFVETDVVSERFVAGIPTTRRIDASTEVFNELTVISEETIDLVRWVVLPYTPQIRYITLCAEATYVIVDTSKEETVTAAYILMNTEVYARMTLVFGTSNPDSASAYERTWNLMAATPSDWSSASLKDDNSILLDTGQKILDYANAKVLAVKNYGIWRMQRIQQFKDERAAILAP